MKKEKKKKLRRNVEENNTQKILIFDKQAKIIYKIHRLF